MDTAQEQPPSRREAAEAMRARLVAAAIEQLADDGMRALTHRKVEQRAGVSQGLVKYHFGSLDGLVEAVVEHMADVELGAVFRVGAGEQAAGFATGEVPEAVWRAARASWEAITSRPGLVRARFELYLHAATHPELQAIIRRGRERFISAAAQSLPSADPRASAHLVLALVNGLLLHRLSAPDDSIDEAAPSLILAAGTAALLWPYPPEPR